VALHRAAAAADRPSMSLDLFGDDVPTTDVDERTPAEDVTGVYAPEAVPVTAADTLPVVPVPAATAQTLQQTVAPGAAAASVLGFHPRRRSVILTNIGSAAVVVGFSQSVTVDDGYPIAAGQTVQLVARSGIFTVAVAAGGRLAVLAQYDEG